MMGEYIFDEWYINNIPDLNMSPIGSRDYCLQKIAWKASARINNSIYKEIASVCSYPETYRKSDFSIIWLAPVVLNPGEKLYKKEILEVDLYKRIAKECHSDGMHLMGTIMEDASKKHVR